MSTGARPTSKKLLTNWGKGSTLKSENSYLFRRHKSNNSFRRSILPPGFVMDVKSNLSKQDRNLLKLLKLEIWPLLRCTSLKTCKKYRRLVLWIQMCRLWNHCPTGKWTWDPLNNFWMESTLYNWTKKLNNWITSKRDFSSHKPWRKWLRTSQPTTRNQLVVVVVASTVNPNNSRRDCKRQ